MKWECGACGNVNDKPICIKCYETFNPDLDEEIE